MRSIVLMSLTGVLLLGGCGGESGATNHSLMRLETAIDPTSQTRAEAMVITSADLPAAWTATPDDANRDKDAACVDGSGLTEIGRAFSDVLERTDAGYDVHIQSQAIVFQSEDQAKTWFARLRDDAVLACVRRTFIAEQQQYPDPNITFDISSAGNLPVAKAGDESAGLRLTIKVSEGNNSLPAYLDLVFVRVGDATGGLELFSVREPFDDTEQISGSPTTADMTGVIADRMAAARGS